MIRQALTGGTLRTHRVETLADGVFAIVMTLLVLDLRTGSAAGPDLTVRLAALWPKFLAYALSFVILGVYWTGHAIQYQFIRRSDRTNLWINVVFLLFVALVPFSASLLGEHGSDPVAVRVRGLNRIVIGLVFDLHWRYATAGHRLVEPDIDPELVRAARRRILIGPAFYAVALLASFVSTALSLALYVVVPLLNVVPGRIDRFWAHRPLPEGHTREGSP